MDAEPFWRSHDGIRTCRQRLEWWGFEWELFDGAWILTECEADLEEDVVAGCLALVIVIRIVAHAVRWRRRGEDLSDDVAEACEYLAALPLRSPQSRQLRRLLGSLEPFHPERVGEELLAAAWQARRDGLDRAARSLVELAYHARVLYGGLDAVAQGAALAIARLAELDECSFTARKWRGIAYVHGRRAARRSIVSG